ncbi:hypothetical protein DIPPA_21250 [Diplonema papillatum]|nr:hypothetical protein DIPPA_21250 [Diplonema papillatum]
MNELLGGVEGLLEGQHRDLELASAIARDLEEHVAAAESMLRRMARTAGAPAGGGGEAPNPYVERYQREQRRRCWVDGGVRVEPADPLAGHHAAAGGGSRGASQTRRRRHPAARTHHAHPKPERQPRFGHPPPPVQRRATGVKGHGFTAPRSTPGGLRGVDSFWRELPRRRRDASDGDDDDEWFPGGAPPVRRIATPDRPEAGVRRPASPGLCADRLLLQAVRTAHGLAPRVQASRGCDGGSDETVTASSETSTIGSLRPIPRPRETGASTAETDAFGLHACSASRVLEFEGTVTRHARSIDHAAGAGGSKGDGGGGGGGGVRPLPSGAFLISGESAPVRVQPTLHDEPAVFAAPAVPAGVKGRWAESLGRGTEASAIVFPDTPGEPGAKQHEGAATATTEGQSLSGSFSAPSPAALPQGFSGPLDSRRGGPAHPHQGGGSGGGYSRPSHDTHANALALLDSRRVEPAHPHQDPRQGGGVGKSRPSRDTRATACALVDPRRGGTDGGRTAARSRPGAASSPFQAAGGSKLGGCQVQRRGPASGHAVVLRAPQPGDDAITFADEAALGSESEEGEEWVDESFAAARAAELSSPLLTLTPGSDDDQPGGDRRFYPTDSTDAVPGHPGRRRVSMQDASVMTADADDNSPASGANDDGNSANIDEPGMPRFIEVESPRPQGDDNDDDDIIRHAGGPSIRFCESYRSASNGSLSPRSPTAGQLSSGPMSALAFTSKRRASKDIRARLRERRGSLAVTVSTPRPVADRSDSNLQVSTPPASNLQSPSRLAAGDKSLRVRIQDPDTAAVHQGALRKLEKRETYGRKRAEYDENEARERAGLDHSGWRGFMWRVAEIAHRDELFGAEAKRREKIDGEQDRDRNWVERLESGLKTRVSFYALHAHGARGRIEKTEARERILLYANAEQLRIVVPLAKYEVRTLLDDDDDDEPPSPPPPAKQASRPAIPRLALPADSAVDQRGAKHPESARSRASSSLPSPSSVLRKRSVQIPCILVPETSSDEAFAARGAAAKSPRRRPKGEAVPAVHRLSEEHRPDEPYPGGSLEGDDARQAALLLGPAELRIVSEIERELRIGAAAQDPPSSSRDHDHRSRTRDAAGTETGGSDRSRRRGSRNRADNAEENDSPATRQTPRQTESDGMEHPADRGQPKSQESAGAGRERRRDAADPGRDSRRASDPADAGRRERRRATGERSRDPADAGRQQAQRAGAEGGDVDPRGLQLNADAAKRSHRRESKNRDSGEAGGEQDPGATSTTPPRTSKRRAKRSETDGKSSDAAERRNSEEDGEHRWNRPKDLDSVSDRCAACPVLDVTALAQAALRGKLWKKKEDSRKMPPKTFYVNVSTKERVWDLKRKLAEEQQALYRAEVGLPHLHPARCVPCGKWWKGIPFRWRCDKCAAPVWQPVDRESVATRYCASCTADISITPPEHSGNCNLCGRVCCRQCLAEQLPLPSLGYSGKTQLPVCSLCRSA